MANILELLPEVEGEEMVFVQGVMREMSETQAAQFAAVYRSRRKDPTTILLLCLLGFVLLGGIHRFYLDHIGMGLLYLFTGGICYIGTIVDLVNHKKLAFEYNQKQAGEIAGIVRASS
jgi:TM2 domain-containing membrane protein YozV